MTANEDGGFKRANEILGILIALFILLLCVTKCNAQTKQVARYDTIPCQNERIVKYISTTSPTGKVRYYAYYKEDTGFTDFVQCSQSIIDYIKMCEDNNVKPSLAIRLKNGRVQSMIRYRPKIKIK